MLAYVRNLYAKVQSFWSPQQQVEEPVAPVKRRLSISSEHPAVKRRKDSPCLNGTAASFFQPGTIFNIMGDREISQNNLSLQISASTVQNEEVQNEPTGENGLSNGINQSESNDEKQTKTNSNHRVIDTIELMESDSDGENVVNGSHETPTPHDDSEDDSDLSTANITRHIQEILDQEAYRKLLYECIKSDEQSKKNYSKSVTSSNSQTEGQSHSAVNSPKSEGSSKLPQEKNRTCVTPMPLVNQINFTGIKVPPNITKNVAQQGEKQDISDWISKLAESVKKKLAVIDNGKAVKELQKKMSSLRDYEKAGSDTKHWLKQLDEHRKSQALSAFRSFIEQMVNDARRMPEHEVINFRTYGKMKKKEFIILLNNEWLNDEIVNSYMAIIEKRSQSEKARMLNFPKVHTYTTFFFLKLSESGFSGVQRWNKKIDLFEYDVLLFPIHAGLRNHWCMACADLRNRTIKYYDSLGGRGSDCLNTLLQYIQEEHKSRFNEKPFPKRQWKLISTTNSVPQQRNSFDCGVFACTFAEYLSRDAPFDFNQNDIGYMRRKMVCELYLGHLLT